jgi:hypothetical protein
VNQIVSVLDRTKQSARITPQRRYKRLNRRIHGDLSRPKSRISVGKRSEAHDASTHGIENYSIGAKNNRNL